MVCGGVDMEMEKKRPVNFVGCNLEWNFAALAKFLARDSLKIRTEANWKNWMAEIRDNSTKTGLCWEAATLDPGVPPT